MIDFGLDNTPIMEDGIIHDALKSAANIDTNELKIFGKMLILKMIKVLWVE